MVALLRTRVHSVLLKKNSLFLTIGPPIEYPNWLRVKPGFGKVVGVVLIGVGRQRGNAIEFVQRSVELVGARLGGDVDHAAARASVLRREVGGHNAELLYRVQRNALTDGSGKQIDVFAAVQQDVGVGRALSVDGIAGAASALHVFGYVTRSRNQVIRVAGQSRQIGDLLRRDNLGQRLGFGVDHSGFARGRDFDRSRCAGHPELRGHIVPGAHIDLHHPSVFLEARCLNGERVSIGL